jgi:LysM repeat protein
LSSVLCRLATISSLAAAVGGCGYGDVVHSWFDHSAGPEAQTNQKLPGHVYLFRGLAGDIYSLGMDQLADKIARHGVTATVHGASENRALAADIIRRYKADEERGPIMLIGHSTGGDAIISVAEKLKAADVPVALAVAFDPTRIADDVPSNVELFIDFYQRNNPIGGGKSTPGPGFHGRLINVDLREHTEIVHITVDKAAELQEIVTTKVVALAARAARAERSPAPKRPLVLSYVVPRDAPIELWDSAVEVKTKPGDTLDAVGATYHVPVWAITQINALESARPIEPGRKLLIPHSLNADAAVPILEPRAMSRSAARPADHVVAKKPTRPERTPTANMPAGSDAAQNLNSFNDRWRVETQ